MSRWIKKSRKRRRKPLKSTRNGANSPFKRIDGACFRDLRIPRRRNELKKRSRRLRRINSAAISRLGMTGSMRWSGKISYWKRKSCKKLKTRKSRRKISRRGLLTVKKPLRSGIKGRKKNRSCRKKLGAERDASKLNKNLRSKLRGLRRSNTIIRSSRQKIILVELILMSGPWLPISSTPSSIMRGIPVSSHKPRVVKEIDKLIK